MKRFPSLSAGLRIGGLAAGLLLAWCYRNAAPPSVQAQDPQAGTTPYDANALASRLVRDYPEVFDTASRTEIDSGMESYSLASRLLWQTNATRTSLTSQQVQENLRNAGALTQSAADRLAAGLRRMPGVIGLSGGAPVSITHRLSIPYGSAVLMLQRNVDGKGLPGFYWRKVDLRAATTIAVDLGSDTNFIAVLELLEPPRPSGQFRLQLNAGSKRVANLNLSITVPPQYPMRIQITDSAGQPTEAAVGLYAGQKLLIPNTALDFTEGGFVYAPLKSREHHNARFWPGTGALTRCFFVRGGFTMDVPAGTYRLLASKGPEFLAINTQVRVGPGLPRTGSVVLRRWCHMSEYGWHSGDTHIHYARADRAANQRLALWAQAEDLEMANILRMGDARKTYFEQYAFGQPGRYLYSKGALVPGQEDPRTGVMGHTISLNLQSPIRDPERRYYLYSTTFDEAHRQGGLSGYAHVNTDSFLVHRDMTLNIPRHKADFAEICEFGSVGTDLYYEFLNLGFRLTAVGGSDAPWGGTVGDSRVYAYTGSKLDPDQWFAAVKAGHTFVTAAPMLDFTVNGHLPGDKIKPSPGQVLKVHARARVGSPEVPLGRLEIVANGDVIRTATSSGTSAVLDFDLPAGESMWIAARATGAHTTPIYITVNGKRHWKLAAVPDLVEQRLRTLDDLDRLIDNNWQNIPPGHDAEWENRNAFRQGAAAMRHMVEEARAVYLKLRDEARAQTAELAAGTKPAQRQKRNRH